MKPSRPMPPMPHSIRRSLLIASLAMSLSLRAWAATEGALEPPAWEIIAECQMVMLPQKAALPLLSDLGDDAKIEAAFTTLQQMIDRGEATLAANLVARGLAGHNLASESVEELRYPTAFDPPQLPTDIPKEKPADFLKAWPVVGITPTAFETRKIGTIFELQATLVSPDGQWISADATPQHVRFLRYSKYDGGLLASGEHLSVDQPLFATLRNTCSLRVHAGQRLLMGVHKVPGEENTMELFIVRIRTQKTGPAK